MKKTTSNSKKVEFVRNSSKRVMIATPSYDGKLDANYVFSLLQTMSLCGQNGIAITPIFVCYDSLVQRARNDLMRYAFEMDVDDLVFIDADEAWKPEDFMNLLSHDIDVVGGTARKKTDIEQYVVKVIPDNGLKREENGLIKVLGIGTGFTRLSKKAIEDLWNFSEKYVDDNGIENRMVFNIAIIDGKLVSEDISMCEKLRALDYTIWFDPSITCDHIGVKNYRGNFLEWEKSLVKSLS